MTAKGVDDTADDHVGSRLRSLDHDERFLKVIGFLHLGTEGETSEGTTVRKDNVGDTSDDADQSRVLGESVPLDGRTTLSKDLVGLNTCSDDGDHSSDEDTDDGKTGHEVELAPFTVVRHED